MRTQTRRMRWAAVMAVLAAMAGAGMAQTRESAIRQTIRKTVDATIGPLMKKEGIPGMAVGVVVDGKGYVFDYGEASLEPRRAVTEGTLFEIGSVSKTFTAALAEVAQQEGRLSLEDKTSRFLPALRGTPYGDDVTLVELGTHTPGGVPLQVPDDVKNDAELMTYLRKWRPAHPPGTYRTYSNIGIGALGLAVQKSLGGDFGVLMEQRVMGPLGMKNSFYVVPAERMADYAEGYRDGRPVRMTKGELWAPTYGVRTTAGDLVRWVEANLGTVAGGTPLGRAIAATHTVYFQCGGMTQDLAWEQYAWPVTLPTLIEGNSTGMITGGAPAQRIVPAEKPRADVWLNKTGTTNGFGTYVAMVPAKKLGIVLLANKNYPMEDRVTAAYEILTALAGR